MNIVFIQVWASECPVLPTPHEDSVVFCNFCLSFLGEGSPAPILRSSGVFRDTPSSFSAVVNIEVFRGLLSMFSNACLFSALYIVQ